MRDEGEAWYTSDRTGTSWSVAEEVVVMQMWMQMQYSTISRENLEEVTLDSHTSKSLA